MPEILFATTNFYVMETISYRYLRQLCSLSKLHSMLQSATLRPQAVHASECEHTFSNRSRTRDAPTPTKSSTNSDAAHEKNGTPASPAMALAAPHRDTENQHVKKVKTVAFSQIKHCTHTKTLASSTTSLPSQPWNTDSSPMQLKNVSLQEKRA